jgi:peptidoglycan/xylan/chitin deacetylase (PgdA/CDA1 family)
MQAEIRKKITKAVRELPIEAARFVRRQYPSFVTAARPGRLDGEVPVFMFHSVEAQAFEEQLDFLKRNGYRTLALEEFAAFLDGSLRPRDPCVLLTFDDGDRSWYTTAYPLLRRYGYRGAAFVVPHYLREQPDGDAGAGWLSWPELVEMDRSGVLDVQSHTLRHERVFTGASLQGFFHPGFETGPLGMDVPWVDEGSRYTNALAWGTPIYECAPRLQGRLRFLDEVRVREACVSWVERHGGADFFGHPGWQRELRRAYREALRGGAPGTYESPRTRSESMLHDLVRARTTLEERLGKRVRHLCFPWGAGSDLAVSLSREAGYETCFWCSVGGRRSNRPGASPFHITRLKDDYIFRLPGKGRKPLIDIFKGKLLRRAGRLDIY